MKALFCMSFGKKKEYIVNDVEFVEYQLGHALIIMLSTDISSFIRKLDHEFYSNYALQAADITEKAIEELKPIHPFFENITYPLFLESDPMLALHTRLTTIKEVQLELTPLVDAVFLDDGTDLSAMQRLCMFFEENRQEARFFGALSDVMRVERRIYVDGKAFDFLSPDKSHEPISGNISNRQIVGSDDLKAVLMTEIAEMAQQNVRLRRCEYCHKYFRPFSSKSIYCDRLVGNTGKTCQEVAAKEKHTKKVAANEGRALYQRRNRAYAMRVSRTPEVYKDVDYQVWKATAKVALQQYTDGEITLEMLDVMIELPKKK